MTPSAQKRRASLAWKPKSLTYWQLTKRILRRIDDHDLLGRASGLAFNFVLALFPLLLFLLTLFALFASQSAELESSLLKDLDKFLPAAAAHLMNEVTGELAANASSGGLTFEILLVLWFASGGVSSMISSLNVALQVPENRSWLKIRAIALGLTLAMSLLLISALFMVLVGGRFVDWAGAILHLGPFVLRLWSAMQWPGALLFVTLAFSLIYSYGPSAGRYPWHWVTPGSVCGVVLWLFVSLGFRVYLHFFNTYTTTYGSLGAVMILLVWLYVTGLAFLIGAEVNAEIENASRPHDSA